MSAGPWDAGPVHPDEDDERGRRAAEAVNAISAQADLQERFQRLAATIGPVARASALTARLCEATGRDPAGRHMRPWFLRAQSLAVVAGEGMATDEMRVLALAAGDPGELVSKAERTASDVQRALEMAMAVDPDAVEPGDVLAVYAASERSNRRLENDSMQWRLEQDADAFAGELRNLAASRTPTGAAEIFRRLLTGKRFEGRSRRMALLLAPMLVRTGYGCPRAHVGMAAPVARAAGAFEAAAGDEEEFAVLFHEGVASEARRSLDALATYARVEAELARMLPAGRSTSRASEALSAIVSQPLLTAGELARLIRATPKGGQLVMDRLVACGAVAPHDTGRSKGRIYVCRRAVGI